jgi:binding-protein-dependent transport system inner membrane component
MLREGCGALGRDCESDLRREALDVAAGTHPPPTDTDRADRRNRGLLRRWARRIALLIRGAGHRRRYRAEVRAVMRMQRCGGAAYALLPELRPATLPSRSPVTGARSDDRDEGGVMDDTAFGVASIKRDHPNVAAILQLSWPRRLVTVILPAAAPAIVAGLRISVGSAWVAIVAAERLIGGTGIGYFVSNEWNNLALTSVIFAILAIGVIGVLLDAGLGRLSRRLSYEG